MKQITLKTLETSTEQEVFDFIINHLLTQKMKSAEMTMCKYRTTEGLKCAVGCIISDEEYDPSMEGMNVISLPQTKKSIHLDLLKKLQSVHDNYNPVEWSDKLRIVAQQFVLKFNYKT